MASVNFVLKAIDQYSGVITGLNQGFELVSKSINAVRAVADTAFSAISSGVQIAAEGGGYAEIRRQFNNVATSFSADGQAILDDLDKITSNMLPVADAAKLAGKGIAAGLSQEQLATAFEFVKRRTELTGESFEGLSDQVLNAISTGKTSVLGQMGIFVEKGESLDDIMKKLSVATKSYGDAGFNAADKLAALSAQKDKFLKTVGVAINEMPIFQKALSFVSDTVVTLVDSFDPRPITAFLDTVLNMVFDLSKGVISSIPIISDTFDSLFSNTSSEAGDFAISVSKSFFSIAKGAATTVNAILDILEKSGITTVIEFIVSSSITLVETGLRILLRAVGGITNSIITAISGVVQSVQELANRFPKLAEYFGLNQQSTDSFIASLESVSQSAGSIEESFNTALKSVGDFGRGITAGVSEAARTARIDTSVIDKIEQGFEERIKSIDFSKKWGEALSGGLASGLAGLDGTTAAEEKRLAAEEKRRKSEQEKALKALENEAKQRSKLEESEAAKLKAQEDKNAKLAETELKKLEEEALKKQKLSEEIAKKALDKELENKKEIQAAFEKSWESIRVEVKPLLGLDAEKLLGLSDFQRRGIEQAQEQQERMARDRMKFESELRMKEREQIAELDSKKVEGIRSMFQGVDWPAEFRALGEFIFNWAVAKAVDEPVPLVVLTTV